MGSEKKPAPIKASDLRDSAFEAYSFIRDRETTLREELDRDLGRIRARSGASGGRSGMDRLIADREKQYQTAISELRQGPNQQALDRYYALSREEAGNQSATEALRRFDSRGTGVYQRDPNRRYRAQQVGQRTMDEFASQADFLEQEFGEQYIGGEDISADTQARQADPRYRGARRASIPAFPVAKMDGNPWT